MRQATTSNVAAVEPNAPRSGPEGTFSRSVEQFEAMMGFLKGEKAGELTHSELEDRLTVDGRELIRQLYQDHLSLRAVRETRLKEVVDAQGVPRKTVVDGRERALTTVFGKVTVERNAYRRRDQANLYPADAILNLPVDIHSHGLRRLAALESARGSFEDATEAVERGTGQRLGKRQVEELAQQAACDFDQFYAERERAEAGNEEIQVLTVDGKGIVMLPGSLRDETAAAAAKAVPKLETRLSPGEKRNRKRMATVGSVYDAVPVPRSPADILASNHGADTPKPAPRAINKWAMASVAEDAASVVGKVFAEAGRRDPKRQRKWIALVDGNNYQIDRIKAEAKAMGVEVKIVIDFIHVLEYLWKAARSFYPADDPEAESWVHDRALAILEGGSAGVAGGIRRWATNLGLGTHARAQADECANYLTNKRPHLDYPTALKAGWPIATGVIEGACRHLVKDRMDITGARWSLDGAEAVLRLRALHTNGDFDDYWTLHLAQERQRVHEARYAGNVIPSARAA
jgi:hypothetical protein